MSTREGPSSHQNPTVQLTAPRDEVPAPRPPVQDPSRALAPLQPLPPLLCHLGHHSPASHSSHVESPWYHTDPTGVCIYHVVSLPLPSASSWTSGNVWGIKLWEALDPKPPAREQPCQASSAGQEWSQMAATRWHVGPRGVDHSQAHGPTFKAVMLAAQTEQGPSVTPP